MSELDTWKQLAEEVAQGNLTLAVHREDLDAAVKDLQEYIGVLDGLHHQVAHVVTVSGFGGFQMAADLERKFSDKGGGGHESIQQRINELAAEAKAIADTIRKAAAAYAETDQQSADALRNGTQS